VNDQTVLLRDHIAKQKKVTAPNYHPIEVAVSHLTCTVKAAPPQKTQTTVATQLNCLAQAKAKKEPIDILHDVNFFLRPGQMTLLLGAPGTLFNSSFFIIENLLAIFVFLRALYFYWPVKIRRQERKKIMVSLTFIMTCRVRQEHAAEAALRQPEGGQEKRHDSVQRQGPARWQLPPLGQLRAPAGHPHWYFLRLTFLLDDARELS
jgi:hypothetical protein